MLTELEWRLVFFLGTLTAVALVEQLWPRRVRSQARLLRWPNNLGIMALGAILVRLLVPLTAMGAAALAEANQWGLFQQFRLPQALTIVLGLLLLDLAIWAQHRLFHAIPWLWRLHRMHHADLDFDVTTGIRFHPLEILLSMLIKVAVVMALGLSPLTVLVFEILLNGTSLFNHGNLRLPASLDRYLRWFVVTPDMHRVHHSWYRDETDSNFGFNLPWWDRLFGTYRAQPRDGHEKMIIGLPVFRDAGASRLDRLLLQPFRQTIRVDDDD